MRTEYLFVDRHGELHLLFSPYAPYPDLELIDFWTRSKFEYFQFYTVFGLIKYVSLEDFVNEVVRVEYISYKIFDVRKFVKDLDGTTKVKEYNLSSTEVVTDLITTAISEVKTTLKFNNLNDFDDAAAKLAEMGLNDDASLVELFPGKLLMIGNKAATLFRSGNNLAKIAIHAPQQAVLLNVPLDWANMVREELDKISKYACSTF